MASGVCASCRERNGMAERVDWGPILTPLGFMDATALTHLHHPSPSHSPYNLPSAASSPCRVPRGACSASLHMLSRRAPGVSAPRPPWRLVLGRCRTTPGGWGLQVRARQMLLMSRAGHACCVGACPLFAVRHQGVRAIPWRHAGGFEGDQGQRRQTTGACRSRPRHSRPEQLSVSALCTCSGLLR